MIRNIVFLLALVWSACVCASPGFEFVFALRNPDGTTSAGIQVQVQLDIVSTPLGDGVLYNETHTTESDSKGLIHLLVGSGTSDLNLTDVDWSTTRYLRATIVPADGKSVQIGTFELMGSPLSLHAQQADGLVSISPDGSRWKINADNNGNLSWIKINSGTPVYDTSLVPDNLFFIGTFASWDISKALPMDKLSDTRFCITREIQEGEIFKFTPTQSWDNARDWSAGSCNIGYPNPMRERGNTPAFPGPSGTYTITVDFYNYTMTLTEQ